MMHGRSKLMLSGVITHDSVSDCYLSECPQLGVASAGNTIEDAKVALRDAVDGFLKVCADRGTLEKVLRDRGVDIYHETTHMFNISTEGSPAHAVGRTVLAI